ncbi:MAG: hypothetical protein IH926_12130, partial [Proteobacteria bacterium]|nr:hypothetical protein [Pseudomonadota bacterium]
MPHQKRVTPFNDLIAIPARGTQKGNAFQFTLTTDADLQGGSSASGAIAAEGFYRELYTPEWTQLPGAIPAWLTETARSFVSCDA